MQCFVFHILLSHAMITFCTFLFIHVNLYPLWVELLGCDILNLRVYINLSVNIFHSPSLAFVGSHYYIPQGCPQLLSQFCKECPLLKCSISYYAAFGSTPGSFIWSDWQSTAHSQWRTELGVECPFFFFWWISLWQKFGLCHLNKFSFTCPERRCAEQVHHPV